MADNPQYAFTGHRPNRLGGHSLKARSILVDFALTAMNDFIGSGGIRVACGMALGWDQAVATAALALGIPVVAYIPFDGQESGWPDTAKAHYAKLLSLCSEVIVCSPGGYSPEKMQLRNQAMVDGSVQLIALWDGKPGGTSNCVSYAMIEKSIPVENLWPKWIRHRKTYSKAY